MYSTQREDTIDETSAKEFPVLCETCIGDNPYVRMTRESYGKPCKICERPFTVFRWKPGNNARFKKTEVCTVCAKLKNVCQTCILDLQYGLPTRVRDAVLEEHEKVNIGNDFANRGYQMDTLEKLIDANGVEVLPYNNLTASGMLERLARRTPYYKRNENHICSFFMRGECTRGALCPYKHETPMYMEDDPMNKQNIKDRFNGKDDPVADKIMKYYGGEFDSILEPPEDKTVTTLWVGGMEDNVTEEDIRNKFHPFGSLSNIRMVYAKSCAFITFGTRKAAEAASKALFGKLNIRGTKLTLAWGRATDAIAPRDRFGKRPPPGVAVAKVEEEPAGITVSTIAAKVHSNPDANIYLQAPIKPTAPISFVPPPPPGMDSGAYYQSMDARTMKAKLTASKSDREFLSNQSKK